MPSIGARVFLPMFKARFEGFWTPFKIFSSIQTVGNFFNFNICFNVWVVFRLVFAVRAFKQHPPCFWPVFEPQNAFPAMSSSEDLFLIEAKFTFVMQSNQCVGPKLLFYIWYAAIHDNNFPGDRAGSRICKKGGPGGWYNPKIAQK